MSAEAMRDYFARRYGPANVVLAVAGNAEWDQVLDLADRHCGAWQGAPAAREVPPPRGTCRSRTVLREEDQQETVVMVADGPPLESDDRHAARLLAAVLGDSTGSRLYWELIDPGHADGVEVSYQDYNNGGAFYTFLSCDPDLANENLARVAEVYRRTMAEGPSEAELARARNKVLARSVIASERPMGRLMGLGYHWAYRCEYFSIDRELEALGAVTLADLRRVLERWPLLPMSIVSVGPATEVVAPAS
jgi:predicted Zn-dependent peptidase